MEQYQYGIIIGVIIAVIIIALLVRAHNNKKKQNESPVNIDELIAALGGKNNIKSAEANGSKVKVVLNNQDSIDTDKLKALGATGVVSTSQATQIIFGKVSSIIAEALSKAL